MKKKKHIARMLDNADLRLRKKVNIVEMIQRLKDLDIARMNLKIIAVIWH